MNTVSRTILLAGLVAASASVFAQEWSSAYLRGLEAIRGQRWEEARTAFKAAIVARPEDASAATTIPGPVTERPRQWRNGAPYSPNFGAAYAGFKLALAQTEDAARNGLLVEVSTELETLLNKNQHSAETYFILSQAYTNLRDTAKQQDLQTRFEARKTDLKWRIDVEILTAEDRSALGALTGTGSQSGNNTTRPNATNPVGPVPTVANKFALLIGNGEGPLAGGTLPFASNDVMLLREKLIDSAGYGEANIEIVNNGTAAQMRASAQALADRVTPESTIFFYFTGVGANLDGKDFFAGVDTARATDSSTMLAKSEVYQMFVRKGCTIFAFFQVNRPMDKGRYFGQELPRTGFISQTQATIPGSTVTGVVRNGQVVGLFTDAMASVMVRFRGPRIPIQPFGWEVFDYMRGARTPGSGGSGGLQTMTLPQLLNLDPGTAGF